MARWRKDGMAVSRGAGCLMDAAARDRVAANMRRTGANANMERHASDWNAMKVKRIVANIATDNVAAAAAFYRHLLGLELLMDHGWIATYGSTDTMPVQISIASEGGSGTPVPDLSIEVDDVDAALVGMREAGVAIEYGPADEPWGVRRFHVRDPFGRLLNILMHLPGR